MATRIREKAAAREENRDKRPHASARYVRISASKVGIVLDLIRKQPVSKALAILAFTPKSASPEVAKVLKSAIANAENNMDLNQDTLYVAECYADQGPTLKRMLPRARGMGNRIRKRTSHITIVLDEMK